MDNEPYISRNERDEPEPAQTVAGIPADVMAVAANIVASVIQQLTQEFVTKADFEAIPSEIRTMGYSAVQSNQGGVGDSYLKLHGPAPKTAVWGPGRKGGVDYDKIYVGGRTYTPGARTNKILQIGADGSSSWVAAITDPMPTGYEQYDVDKNHIHITGATAGNI